MKHHRDVVAPRRTPFRRPWPSRGRCNVETIERWWKPSGRSPSVRRSGGFNGAKGSTVLAVLTLQWGHHREMVETARSEARAERGFSNLRSREESGLSGPVRAVRTVRPEAPAQRAPEGRVGRLPRPHSGSILRLATTVGRIERSASAPRLRDRSIPPSSEDRGPILR